MITRFLKILRSRWCQRKKHGLEWFLVLISIAVCIFSLFTATSGIAFAIDAVTSFDQVNHPVRIKEIPVNKEELLDYSDHNVSHLLLRIRKFLTQSLVIPSMKTEHIPEMIGSSETQGVIVLAQEPKSVELFLRKPFSHKLLTNNHHNLNREVYLSIEKITAIKGPIDSYLVYVNLPKGTNPDDYPQLKAGIIPAFGIVNASQPLEGRMGEGINYSFKITDIVLFLESQGLWNPEKCLITFVPYSTEAERETVPKIQLVKIGSVILYYI